MTVENPTHPTVPRRMQAPSWLAQRWLRIGVIVGIAAVLTGAGYWLAGNPTLAAYVCPSCYGFDHLDQRTYVEARLSRAERAQLTTDIAEARKRVGTIYGTLQSNPVFLVCASEDCDRKLGNSGAARGVTYGWHVIRVSPRGRSVIVLAHELAHAEFHQRVGWVGWIMRSYPSWFDEGLAVLVARDTRALDFSRASGPRCRVVMSEADIARLPTTPLQWVEQMARSRDLYDRAACAVARWHQVAGRAGVLALVDDLRNGTPFDDAFAKRGRR
jgi:hypothetical protein